MGSKCSTIVCHQIALPSRKADPVSVTPTPTQKPAPRHSTAPRNRRYSRADEQSTVIENPRSPEYFANNTSSKNKGLNGETSTDDALRRTSFSHSTEPSPFLYKKGPLIGKGAYGEVYECLRLNTGELLAVKSFKMGGDTNKAQSYIDKLKKEVQQLRDLSHDNIVKYFTVDVTETANSPSSVVDIILEYVSGGSVRLLLDKFSKLEEKVVAKYIRQVLDGLVYLHDNGIIHRNIKGSNILIDTTGLIKLTDFGISGRPDRFSEENAPENYKANSYYRGPAYWSAPEVVMRKAQGKPADVWSVGCVVIEMLTGNPPWVDQVKTIDDFVKQIALGTPPNFPNSISENCRDFLYKTLKFKPEDRPSVMELLDHPFVKEKNQDSSYMEAESVQGEQEGKNASPERVLDLLRIESKYEKKKDPKKNNFISKYSTDELSINGLNIDAYNSFGSNDFGNHMLSMKSNFQSNGYPSRDSERFEKDPNFSTLAKRSSNANAPRRVPEEEGSKNPEEAMNDMKTGTILKHKNVPKSEPTNEQKKSNPAQGQSEAESKEAMRKRIEEQMLRDLMLLSGQVSSRDENEFPTSEFQTSEFENTVDTKPVKNIQEPKRTAPAPLQNSFFNSGSPTNKDDSNKTKVNTQSSTQFVRNRTGDRKQSWKLSGGITVKKDAEGSLNAGGDPEDTSKMIIERVEEEDNDDTSPNHQMDEAEMKQVQERLRKQYEEQMEMSLARLNSDNIQNAVYEKEPEPESSLFNSSKISPQGLRNSEEDYPSQIIKLTPANHGNMWRIEDSVQENSDHNKSNNWKDGHGDSHDDSSKGLSPHITESDSRSPEGKSQNNRKMSDFARFGAREVSSASLKNESFEKIDNSEEVHEQGYEEIDSAKESGVESAANNEKLGVINEAEEVKEDSLYDDEINPRGNSRPQKG